MTAPVQDNPGVIVFPPLLLLLVIIVGLSLDWLAPLGFLSQVPAIPRIVTGAILFAAGAILASTARAMFVRAGTNVRPDEPALMVVSDGIFARMRKPDVCRRKHRGLGARIGPRLRLDDLASRAGAARSAFRSRLARGALFGEQVRRDLSQLQDCGAALRLEVEDLSTEERT
ncbi:MAG: hypothetical protein ACREDO_03535 [Methyloceanibacter sp.]